MSHSDSDMALHEDIPITSNHQIFQNSESLWNSNNDNHVTHPNSSRHAHTRTLVATKRHHGCTKTSFLYEDTNEYFELARQARLISKGDQMPGSTTNDPGKHAVLPSKNEVKDGGKEVYHTGESSLNGSRFQWNKPFRNRKNKQAVGNHRGEGTSTCSGLSGHKKSWYTLAASLLIMCHSFSLSGNVKAQCRLFWAFFRTVCGRTWQREREAWTE
jgi:hypothetical protein